MASNNQLWQTVIFLFLSKFVKQANEPFAEKLLINAKNVELASRFAEMIGDETPQQKIKLALVKAVKQMEKGGGLQRLDDKTLQLSEEGFSQMHSEVQAAMQKIAENFPESVPGNKPAPAVQ